MADPGDPEVELAQGEVELAGVEAVRLLPLAFQGGQEAGPFPFHDLVEESL